MRALIDKYDYFFFDLWGIIYDGKKVDKTIKDIFKLIREKKKKIIIITNSSKTKSEVFNFLKKKNLNTGLINHIFTSGDFAKNKLFNLKKNFFLIDGKSKKNINFLKKLKLKNSKNLDDADLAMAISINKFSNRKKIFKNLKDCKKKGLKLICINPDLRIINDNYGMGYYYNEYLKMGGKGEYYGKPNPKYYKYICSKLNINLKKKILIIGDTIYNDIIGANNFGIDSLLVKKSKLYKFRVKNFKMITFKSKKFLDPKYTINDLKVFN
tara:strand:- start:1652 stop:2455 length:804 start_codon:yes stop_codon:yes gene_type:complete